MIAQIRRVWPGDHVTTVIVIDHADQRRKRCFVSLDTPTGQFIASLCERVEQNGHGLSPQPMVLTVKPKDRYYGYEIEAAELLP